RPLQARYGTIGPGPGEDASPSFLLAVLWLAPGSGSSTGGGEGAMSQTVQGRKQLPLIHVIAHFQFHQIPIEGGHSFLMQCRNKLMDRFACILGDRGRSIFVDEFERLDVLRSGRHRKCKKQQKCDQRPFHRSRSALAGAIPFLHSSDRNRYRCTSSKEGNIDRFTDCLPRTACELLK